MILAGMSVGSLGLPEREQWVRARTAFTPSCAIVCALDTFLRPFQDPIPAV